MRFLPISIQRVYEMPQDKLSPAEISLLKGKEANEQGNFDEAEELLNTAYKYYTDQSRFAPQKKENQEKLAETSLYLGSNYFAKNQLEIAETYLRSALDVCSAINKPNLLSIIYVNLGIILEEIQNDREALDMFAQASIILETLPDLHHPYLAQANLHSAHLLLKKSTNNCDEKALTHVEIAYQIYAESKDNQGIANALFDKGIAYYHMVRIGEAINCFERALVLFVQGFSVEQQTPEIILQTKLALCLLKAFNGEVESLTEEVNTLIASHLTDDQCYSLFQLFKLFVPDVSNFNRFPQSSLIDTLRKIYNDWNEKFSSDAIRSPNNSPSLITRMSTENGMKAITLTPSAISSASLFGKKEVETELSFPPSSKKTEVKRLSSFGSG